MMSIEQRQQQHLSRILELSHELTSTVSLEPLLHKIVQAAAELTDCEMAGLLLYYDNTHELRFRVTSSYADKLINIPVPIQGSIAGAAYASGEPVIVEDPVTDHRYYRKIEELIGVQAKSLLAVPLQFRNKRIGVLEVENKMDSSPFNQHDIETLTALAAHATVAIENARMVEKLEESRSILEQHVTERTSALELANQSLEQEVGERRRAEAQLREYAIELEARNDELAAFAHTVAHDLRNPVGIVVGYAELLMDDDSYVEPDEVPVIMGTIARFGRKIDRIIQELLVLSGVREMNVLPAPLNMSEVVDEAIDRLLELISHREPEIILPETWPTALGYAPWIEEVWVNYLSNAIKYGGEPPKIELGATPRPDGQISFWIKDNGDGIAPEKHASLFIPFERLDQLKIAGHGLGLSIVRRIVEKLGGQVGVESSGLPGQGSEFYFTLPTQYTDTDQESI